VVRAPAGAMGPAGAAGAASTAAQPRAQGAGPTAATPVADEPGAVPASGRSAEVAIRQALAASVAPGDETNPAARLLRTQFTLVWLQIDAMRTHADEWLQKDASASQEGLGPSA
jgi:hypothetical protein